MVLIDVIMHRHHDIVKRSEIMPYARAFQSGTSQAVRPHGYAWNPKTLLAMESAEQAWTPSPAPLKPGRSGPG